MRARIAARDRRDVDDVARGGLVEPGPLEPAEQGAAGTAGERLAAHRLGLPGRLPDEHGARRAGAGDDGQDRRVVAAATTRGESRTVRVERLGERREGTRAGAGHLLLYTADGTACPAPSKRYGGRTTPRSVMNAVTRSAGVTSNAGLYTATSRGDTGASKPRPSSSAARCSISIASPVGVAGSTVLHGAAT